MNIFALHKSPKLAAKFHCDKHADKMILETTQLLNNAYYQDYEVSEPKELLRCNPKMFEDFPRDQPYEYTHQNHPCTLWAFRCKENWEWLLVLGKELCREYTFRYDKQHACSPLLQWMANHHPVLPESSTNQVTPFPLVMPDQYKLTEDPIRNYRIYYTFGKIHLHKWTRREVPFFINSYRTVYDAV